MDGTLLMPPIVAGMNSSPGKVSMEHLKRNCQLFLQVSIEEFRCRLETFLLTTLDTIEKRCREASIPDTEGWLEAVPVLGEDNGQASILREAADVLTARTIANELQPVSAKTEVIETSLDNDGHQEDLLEEQGALNNESEEKQHSDSASKPQYQGDSRFEFEQEENLQKVECDLVDDGLIKNSSNVVDIGTEESFEALPLVFKADQTALPSTTYFPQSSPRDQDGTNLWCHTCNKSFSDPLPFEVHIRGHEQDKKCVKCFHCGKTFASFSNLKRHRKIHTGVRPHVCTFCARPFLNRSDLVRHWRIHTGERPYRCEICQNAFKYSFNLKTHQQKYHRT